MLITPLACSVEEAADALGIGRTLVFQLLRSGELQSIRVGRRRLIPIAVLDRWLAMRLAAPTQTTEAINERIST